MFMAIWAAALLITFHLCREESSTKETKPRMDKGEEGIYSDLLIPGIHPDPKHLGQDQGQWAQAGPKGPSGPTAEVRAGPSSGSVRQQAGAGPSSGSVRQQAGAGPSSGSVRQQAGAGPSSGSVRQQAGAEPSSPQTEPAQDSTYTSLKARADDADYQHCGSQRPEDQTVVTFSAQDDEVNIQTRARVGD
ncbi:polysialoglycoprotein-like [Carcharodon carcharias]|uniref:polysialoglycoprotein-like n=1 Tax=Carcharodon carcharias TaxID=13397 RepID=UPI001B7F0609|nr:polysialoglycoprotein-like [Carcharodon carcharias]